MEWKEQSNKEKKLKNKLKLTLKFNQLDDIL